MNVRRLLSVAALCAVLVPGTALARSKTEDIKDPVTVTLDTKAKADQIKKGVKLAVLNRKWTISNEKGAGFDAEAGPAWGKSQWKAKIHVAIKDKTVTIKYVGSEGLNAEGNQIHPTYNKIVGYLEKDIPIYVERQVVAAE
jgi:hypothetical protein